MHGQSCVPSHAVSSPTVTSATWAHPKAFLTGKYCLCTNSINFLLLGMILVGEADVPWDKYDQLGGTPGMGA